MLPENMSHLYEMSLVSVYKDLNEKQENIPKWTTEYKMNNSNYASLYISSQTVCEEGGRYS